MLPRPLRYVLLAGGFLIIVVGGIVTGVAAAAHHASGLSQLAAIAVGGALALAIAMLGRAYSIGVRVPALGRQLTAMADATDAGKPVSGRFWAGLRDLGPSPHGPDEGSRPGSDDPFPLPGQPPRIARWMSGRVVISPESVTWVRPMTGRARDLTGAECTGERLLDPAAEMTLTLPGNYRAEILKAMTLHANGTYVELVTQVQFLEILRYSVARTPRARGTDTDRPEASGHGKSR
jgi:hypothetical protein